MNAVTDVESAQRLARRLEDREAIKLGLPLKAVRERVARRISSSPGFLENLRRGRIKNVPSWLMQRLRDAMVSELTSEIQRLEHEIAIAKQIGVDPREDEISKAAAQIAETKKLLGA